MARLSVFEDEAREWAQRSKTTLLTHLATALAASGKVLLIDADPQGSALDWQAQRKAAAGFPVVGLPKPCCTLAPVRSADSTCQRPGARTPAQALSRLHPPRSERPRQGSSRRRSPA